MIMKSNFGFSIVFLLLVCMVLPLHAAVTFQHTLGYAGSVGGATGANNYIKTDSLQPVCEKRLVIYAIEGKDVKIVPTTASSRYAFRRWFSYTNGQESGVSGLVSPSDANGFETDKGRVVLAQKGKYPTYSFDGNPILIYCDQSNYRDYVDNSAEGKYSNATFVEGTLAQRMIFDIRPASSMMAEVEKYRSTTMPTANDTYMEEYMRVAPKGRNLYFGPKYQFVASSSTNVTYQAYPNYYYKDKDDGTIINLSDADWMWNETVLSSADIINDQYIATTYSGSEEKKIYTLTARVRYKKGWFSYEYHYYRIAKFIVTYVDPNEYGPAVNPTKSSIVDALDTLAYRDFNYNKPGTSDPAYYSVPLSWTESSYGFFYNELGLQRQEFDDYGIDENRSDPYYGDYAFLNNSNALNQKYFYRNVYNHGNTGTAADAENGYFLYLDGAQKPGECFSMKIHTDLCAGMVLWFSAYVVVLNNQGNSPLINLAISGIEEDGTVEEITTFVSGELTSAGKGQWLRILCPIEIKEDNIYPEYHLIITNKGNGSNGNDLAIDDIGLFVTHPNVLPLQASSSVCVDASGDEFITYLRVAYEEAMLNAGMTLYYQWLDSNNQAVEMSYYGRTGSEKYGTLVLPEAEPTTYLYANFKDFDTYVTNNVEQSSAIGYVRENGKWVLYIATHGELQPEQTYVGSVAGSVTGLLEASCGVYSELHLKGSMYMSINRERLLDGQEIIGCGNRLLRFGVERLILTSTSSGMKEQKAVCNADWLWGTPSYIDNNHDIYGATYEEIKNAIMNGSMPLLLANLKNKGLFFRDKKYLDVYLSADEEKRWLGYTAFPKDGTGRLLNTKGEATEEIVDICTNPIVGEVTLSQPDDNVLRIGSKDEGILPDIVVSNIRAVRMSASQCGSAVTLPIYSEETNRQFNIANAELISTTNPDAGTIYLPLVNPTVSSSDTEITLEGGINGTGQLKPGYEYVFALHESNFSEMNCNTGATYFRVIVVPDCVKWSSTANDVWNNDANWQTADGKQAWCPLAGTDVILSESNYKLLLHDDEMKHGANPYLQYDINYEPNTCNNIYVPVGAALLNQHLLDITGKPVVEMSVPTNQWTLCAMPVAGCVSGDLWSPAAGESQTDPFTVASISQTVGASADDRLVNRVWQSLFNKQISNKTTKEDVDVSSSTWTAPLNALTTSYPAGTGVALWVENSNGGNQVTFRLPKTDAAYHYWQANKWHARSETVSRTANGLAYQQDMTIALQNHDNTGDMFLFGNPTLAYIDMAKLTESNPELAGSWYVLTDNTADLSQELTASVKDVSTDGGDYSLLAPGRAVLLKRQTPGGTLSIKITPEMLTLPESKTALSAPKRAKERARNYALYISATSSGGFTSRAVVQNAWGANDAYRQGEDATVFLMDEWTTPFGIYTISSDHQPLSINLFSDMELIPLACYAQQPTDTLQFSFEGEAGYVGEWHLYDAEEDTRTKLAAGMTLPLAIPTDGKVRYYLEKPADIHPIPTDEPSMEIMPQVQVTGRIGELSVSANTEMERIAVYDVVGRLAATGNAVSSAQWQLPQGVYVVSISINDAEQTSVVLVR